jgi:DNA-binding NtrC family response regulator
MRVLIVDDEDSLLLSLVANLELEGFEVVAAPDGARALELVQKERFDLLLTDVRMPGMNGVDLFRQIRRLCPEMPVILMTAYAVEALIDEAIQEGVFTVLPKPFDIEHVIAALSRAVSHPMVLVVDRVGDAESTAQALKARGILCGIAGDERESLAALEGRNVDVVLLNVGMEGGTTAPELVRRLLTLDASIAVIAISSHLLPEVFRRVAALGAFACLLKPVQGAELVRVIAKARARPVAPPPTRAHSHLASFEG